ncbi:MAG: alpha/beta fold hydrolase [Betaproteobacteria bacterium]|nr:alpha/beta fold hydrolase [Betaproteobacteria bacterium]
MNSTTQTPAPARGEARTRDGTRIGYNLYGGKESKKRVVLIHSLALDRDFWQPVVQALGSGVSLLAYDCRGHGASDKPAGPYTVELFARDLADLLDSIGWDSALVAGASMGGCVTLAFAAAYPERATSIGLIDTTAWYGAEAPKQWEERAQKAISDGLQSMTKFQTTRWFSDAFRAGNPPVMAKAVETFLRNDVKAYAESCRMLGACDMRAALPGFRMPAAVIVGEEDYAAPVAMAEALHRGIANSTLKVIQGGRHLTPLEVPQIIATELNRLLETKR